ncbi:MAG TPA: chloride channel protein [Methylomirabilota bacterium]|nr:chloride channel protein [Methylomirabilota bacterium]
MPFWTNTQLLGDAQRFFRRHWQRLLRIREKIRFSEETFHLVLAGGVGVLGGLVNLVFYYATEWVKELFLRRPGDPAEVAELIPLWQLIITPTLGGLGAGLVLYWGLRLAGPQRSSNLLEVVVAGDGRLPFRSAMVKFISSLITIGSGGSIGREGGITQLAATLASKWGQLAKWHPYRLRLLVGCGAASGIAAAYNAPISGAVFAALVVLGNFSMSLFAPLVFASVIAAMVSRSFFGIRPWYTVPPFEFTSLTQLPWFLSLGLVTGVAGALFLRLLNLSEEAFKKLRAPVYVRLALGGLLVGILATQFPQVWGNGYVVTNRILHGEYGSTTFSADDVVQLEPLATRLKANSGEDLVSHFISGQLSAATQDELKNYIGGPDRKLQESLARDLNLIIRHGPVYDPERFAKSALSSETVNLLRQDPKGGDLIRLNRMLLIDAYPGELVAGRVYSNAARNLLFLVGLFLAKLIATLATVGSGAVGGVFTPTLFLGAGLGAAFGLGLQQLGAGEGLPLAPFAVVGMGSMLSATTRSPLLAMIMIFEISLDYSLMPPMMLACVVSVLVARKLHPESIYTEPLRRKGVMVSQDATTSEAATERTVADLMRAPVTPVRENSPLGELANRFLTSANNFLPVVDARNQLVGMVALQDLKEYLGSSDQLLGVIAYDVMRPPPSCVTPNQRLLDILPVALASEQRNIPVVNTLKENRLVGALGRGEVLGMFSEMIAARSKAEV